MTAATPFIRVKITVDTPYYLSLLSDLVTEAPAAQRLQNVVTQLRERFDCGAVVLLRLQEGHLRPLAQTGLVSEALGRRFAVHQHPRLAAILARQGVTCFAHDNDLPDPYDGLLDTLVGEPLPVHDCMGVSLWPDGRLWGVLTLDSLQTGRFAASERAALAQYALLVEVCVRLAQLEGEIQRLRLASTESHSSSGSGNSGNGGNDPHSDGDAADTGGEIVGQSPAISALLQELRVVAGSELPVLLLGETGVGKELFARWLQRHSPRSSAPFIHVNCAALPESLAESELFGHARGAFSGATSERAGRFEAAHGGTLFLDEVGELALSVQAKLLRTLQNGEIQRLGSDRPRQVNVRIVAATNRNLREEVASGAFRADLYHRLSVYPVPIPPLRDRGSDVLLLAGRFLELNRARLGVRSLRLSTAAQEALMRYRWPGNVRELEHVISRAALKALSRGASRNDIITLEPALLDLGHDLELATGAAPAPAPEAVPVPIPIPAPAPLCNLKQGTAAYQRQHIETVLQAQQHNWAAAARQLGLDASNLHKLAKRLGAK